jgi:hypothetical protein
MIRLLTPSRTTYTIDNDDFGSSHRGSPGHFAGLEKSVLKHVPTLYTFSMPELVNPGFYHFAMPNALCDI